MNHLSSLHFRLSRAPARAKRALHAAVSASAQDALSLARVCVPVRTGRLRASLHEEMDQHTARVSAGVYYAVYVERRRPYLMPSARDCRFSEHAKKNLKGVF